MKLIKENLKKNKGVDEIFTPHPTSYNSSGDETSDGGRPNGSTEGDNSVNEKNRNTIKIIKIQSNERRCERN